VLRTRPLSTTTFRLTLAYLGLFSLSALTLLAVVYMVSMRFIDRQTREPIDDEITWMLETYERGGLEVLKTIVDERAAAEPNRRAMYLLVDRRGRFLAGNLDRVPPDIESNGAFSRFEVQVTEDGRRLPKAHVATAKTVTLDDGARLLVGRDVHDGVQIQRLMRMAILIGAGVMVVLGLGGGLIMSRWMLSRLERINRATAQIMTGDLAQRIRTEGAGDEFDELAQNLNAMLDRIERLLVGMRQVTDDIAHDLRTPLNRLRSRIEVALMGELKPDEGRELLEATMQDADRLIETFNALLNIARAEAGAQQTEWERIDLTDVARDVIELYEPLAEERGLSLQLTAANSGAVILGHRQLVAQAIANVTDNAIKYTPEGGRVTIITTAQPAPAVAVTDTGPGIPAELREQAKQRFVRLDAQRSTPGSGLGLSLVDAVAKLHEARLELADNRPGLAVSLIFRPPPPAEVEAPEARPTAVAA
jgi:signal transduction histidine kinase